MTRIVVLEGRAWVLHRCTCGEVCWGDALAPYLTCEACGAEHDPDISTMLPTGSA